MPLFRQEWLVLTISLFTYIYSRFQCYEWLVLEEKNNTSKDGCALWIDNKLLPVIQDLGYLSPKVVGTIDAQRTGRECESCAIRTLYFCHTSISIERSWAIVAQLYCIFWPHLKIHQRFPVLIKGNLLWWKKKPGK